VLSSWSSKRVMAFPAVADRGSEIHADLIFAAMHGMHRQLQMTVVHFCRNWDAVDDQVCGGSIPEVEQKGAGKTGNDTCRSSWPEIDGV